MTSLFGKVFRRLFTFSALFLSVFALLGGEARAIIMERPYQAAWTSTAGGNMYDGNIGVTTDGKGNVYAAGNTYSSFYGSNAGFEDFFVVKYNGSGDVEWGRQMGTATYDEAYGVAVDASGNVYVVGSTAGDLDGNTSLGGYDFFVVKFNPAGEKLWTRQMGTSSFEYAYGISLDGAGNVYVAGMTEGGFAGSTNAGGYDVFVVKLNAAGTTQWTRQMGSAADDYTSALAVDADGNAYVAGSTWGSLDGRTTVTGFDIFAVKFSSAGSLRWVRQLGANADYDAFASGIAVDGAGNTYISGSTDGRLSGNVSAGNNDAIVVKYDTNGTKQWARQFGTSDDDSGYGIAVDGAGNSYVVGTTDGSLDGNVNLGGLDRFVVKFTSGGANLWTLQFGTAYDEYYTAPVAVDGAGEVFVGGEAYNTITGTDAYLVKLVTDPYSSVMFPFDGQAMTDPSQLILGTAKASNGVSFVEVSTDGGATWQTANGTDNWLLILDLPTGGTCNVKSRATDSLGNVESPAPGVNVTVGMPLSIASLTASPASPQAQATQVIWTTVASGGDGPCQYKYWRKGPDTAGAYVVARDWDASPNWVWTPALSQVGPNTVKVHVKNISGGTSVQMAKGFSVTEFPAILIQDFSSAPSSPQAFGTLITWDATVTGGSGSYLYKYYRKGLDTGGVYTVARDWDASASWGWTPDAAQVGSNTVMVKVKNVSGGAITQAAKGFKVQ